MKRTIIILFAIFSVFSFSSFAEDKEINVYIDGGQVGFDTAPEIVEGRTFVPLRAIAETLDAQVEWNSDTKEITLTKNGVSTKLAIGNTSVTTTDGSASESEQLEAAPYIKDERTMVPLRFITESFGMDVGWDDETHSVSIKSPEEKEQEDSQEDEEENQNDEQEQEQEQEKIIAYYADFPEIPDFGAYFEGKFEEKTVNETIKCYYGASTENLAEYQALLEALGFVKSNGLTDTSSQNCTYEKGSNSVILLTGEDYISVTPIFAESEKEYPVVYYRSFPGVVDFGEFSDTYMSRREENNDGSVTVVYFLDFTKTENQQTLKKYVETMQDKGFVQQSVSFGFVTGRNDDIGTTVTLELKSYALLITIMVEK